MSDTPQQQFDKLPLFLKEQLEQDKRIYGNAYLEIITHNNGSITYRRVNPKNLIKWK